MAKQLESSRGRKVAHSDVEGRAGETLGLSREAKLTKTGFVRHDFKPFFGPRLSRQKRGWAQFPALEECWAAVGHPAGCSGNPAFWEEHTFCRHAKLSYVNLLSGKQTPTAAMYLNSQSETSNTTRFFSFILIQAIVMLQMEAIKSLHNRSI